MVCCCSSTLLSAISLLLHTSPSAQQQLLHSKGFLIIAHMLNEVYFYFILLFLFHGIGVFIETDLLSKLKKHFFHSFVSYNWHLKFIF